MTQQQVDRSLWHQCQGAAQIRPLHSRAFRVVESQEVIATRDLVDTLAEQELLEQLLDQTKPLRPQAHRHYLITTPFRYPPLKHGSRFGRRHEPSLFYGATTLPTALAETAYYRLVFMEGLSTPFSRPLNTEHTSFYVNAQGTRGIQLHKPPFADYRYHITHPRDYTQTQCLGTSMRESGVELFQYLSARDPEGGINIGIFEPDVIRSNSPQQVSRWLCQTTPAGVSFRSIEERHSLRNYPREVFLVEGSLPAPAV